MRKNSWIILGIYFGFPKCSKKTKKELTNTINKNRLAPKPFPNDLLESDEIVIEKVFNSLNRWF